MTTILFAKWISHFVKSVQKFGGVSPTRRHLLILDGHCSHVSIDTVHEAKQVGLDMLTLPLHTSHTMQPLDVCLFKPFKTAFKAYRDFWTYKSQGAAVKKENLVEWVSLALQKALTMENITKGFLTTGIWLLNPDAMEGKMNPSQIHQNAEEEPSSPPHIDIQEVEDDVCMGVDPLAQQYFVTIESSEAFGNEELGVDKGTKAS